MRDAIINIIDSTIAEKRDKGIRPASCSKLEIMNHIADIVTDVMRELHTTGKYVGGITINKLPTLYELNTNSKD